MIKTKHPRNGSEHRSRPGRQDRAVLRGRLDLGLEETMKVLRTGIDPNLESGKIRGFRVRFPIRSSRCQILLGLQCQANVFIDKNETWDFFFFKYIQGN